MSIVLEVLAIFITIAFAIAFISNTLNRGIKELETEAENIVRSRISSGSFKNKSSLLILDLSHNEEVVKIQYLIAQLSKRLKIGELENKLHSKDVLSDLFRVQKQDLIVFENTWKKIGLGDYLEVFSNELLTFLNNVLDRDGRNRFLKELDIENEDDQVLDSIMTMTVKKFFLTVAKSKWAAAEQGRLG